MRLRTDFWVKAYVRTVNGSGASAFVLQRGEAEAGAVYVVVNRLDGTAALYAPAATGTLDRAFVRAHAETFLPEAEVTARIAKEASIDPDFWVIEVETKAGTAINLPLLKAD
ncbi:MAG: DUF1491 family protein [Pseudomonadota bacterium]